MKILGLGIILMPFFLSSFVFGNSKNLSSNLVLVYKDAGSCDDACAEAAAEIPASMGYQIQFVQAQDIKPMLFKKAILWIQPGGNAITAAKTIGLAKLALIRDFIYKGGAYVGFCAGAFLADTTVDDEGKIRGLGILPVETYDAPIDSNDGMGTMIWINWNNQLRHVFFNGGGGFKLDSKTKGVQVLARFHEGGKPVTIQNKFGQGNVVVTGAHPEAPYYWKSEGKLMDQDESDQFLAKDMVLRALTKF